MTDPALVFGLLAFATYFVMDNLTWDSQDNQLSEQELHSPCISEIT